MIEAWLQNVFGADLWVPALIFFIAPTIYLGVVVILVKWGPRC